LRKELYGGINCTPLSYTVQAASHATSLITLFLARIPRTLPRTIPSSHLALHYHPRPLPSVCHVHASTLALTTVD